MIVADYISFIGKNDEPLGHGKKILDESIELLKEKVDITVAACGAYLQNQIESSIIVLRAIIPAFNNRKAAYRQYVQEMLNLIKIFKYSKRDCIWFTNVDWVLFAYLAIFNPDNTVFVTLYRDLGMDLKLSKSKLSKEKYKLFISGMKHVKTFVVTNPSLQISKKQINVPDYFCTDFYKPYQDMEKLPQIACVGIIRDSKDVKGLVDHFKHSRIHIIIAGEFVDYEIYEYVTNNASENITIVNKRLNENEYYELLGKSKYVIMPYKPEMCLDATSGILLETIFCKSIPIAPEILLKNNQINGISYKRLTDLPTEIGKYNELAETVKNTLERFNKALIQEKLIKAFELK